MYLTPIMYDINIIDNTVLAKIMKLNPLYLYINFARMIILGDQWRGSYMPSWKYFLACGGSALFILFLGVVIFKKKQDKFIYYV